MYLEFFFVFFFVVVVVFFVLFFLFFFGGGGGGRKLKEIRKAVSKGNDYSFLLLLFLTLLQDCFSCFYQLFPGFH